MKQTLSHLSLLSRKDEEETDKDIHLTTEIIFDDKPLPAYIRREVIRVPIVEPKYTSEELINTPQFKFIRDLLFDPNGPPVKLQFINGRRVHQEAPTETDSMSDNLTTDST